MAPGNLELLAWVAASAQRDEVWTRQFDSSAGDKAFGVAVDSAGDLFNARRLSGSVLNREGLLGNPIGIIAFTLLGYLLLRFTTKRASLPFDERSGQQLRWWDVPLLGLFGAIGFTVALFVAEAAGGHPSLKLGALASFAYLALAVTLGKVMVRTQKNQGSTK